MKDTQPYQVTLCFEVEELDVHTASRFRLPATKQLQIATEGLTLILDTLQGLNVKATFFCTDSFAQNRPELIKRITAQGHQLASRNEYSIATPITKMVLFGSPQLLKNSAIQVPVSLVTPLRIPLSGAALHVLPLALYQWLCDAVLGKQTLLNINFYSWEFSDRIDDPQLKLPNAITKNSGKQLSQRLATVICHLKENKKAQFVTLSEATHSFNE